MSDEPLKETGGFIDNCGKLPRYKLRDPRDRAVLQVGREVVSWPIMGVMSLRIGAIWEYTWVYLVNCASKYGGSPTGWDPVGIGADIQN